MSLQCFWRTHRQQQEASVVRPARRDSRRIGQQTFFSQAVGRLDVAVSEILCRFEAKTMVLPSGDQTGLSSLAASNVNRVLVPRATSTIQRSREPADRAQPRCGSHPAIRPDSRSSPDSPNVPTDCRSGRTTSSASLDPRSSAIHEGPGVGHGEQTVEVARERIDAFRNRHRFTTELHSNRIERLRHQRGVAQEDQMP